MKRGSLRRIRTVPRLPPRLRAAHKGDFGRVLIVGGSRGMVGAPSLAANAALRSGAGLVTVACPQSIQLAVATLCPCATTIPLPETSSGTINPRGAAKEFATRGLFNGDVGPTVVAGGPGLARGDSAFGVELLRLWSAFALAGVALVLDADALNALTKSARKDGGGWNQIGWTRTVMTPHPGELARMQGVTTREIQADREGWAVRTAREMAARGSAAAEPPVLVLKGAGTIVSDGHRIFVNKSGNPGMATGGTGDVLTGVIAALIGQGMSCFDAAVLGVHVHGWAGDLAAKSLGQISLMAADLIEFLAPAFMTVES